MSSENNGFFFSPLKGQEQSFELMKKLTDVAQPGAVYTEPVIVGEYTIITASEVSVGLGFGYGGGGEQRTAEAETEEEQARPTSAGSGGGGGGGGHSTARPVAAIIISPDGVRVEPIVDVTKISALFVATLGSILLMFFKLFKK